MHDCKSESEVEHSISARYEQKFATAKTNHDHTVRQLFGNPEAKMALRSLDELYTKCIETKGKERFCTPDQCVVPAQRYPKCWGKGITHYNNTFNGNIKGTTWLLHTKPYFAQVETEEDCLQQKEWQIGVVGGISNCVVPDFHIFTEKKWTDTISYHHNGNPRVGLVDEQYRRRVEDCPYHNQCYVWQHMWDGDARSSEGEALHAECLNYIQTQQVISGVGSVPIIETQTQQEWPGETFPVTSATVAPIANPLPQPSPPSCEWPTRRKR